MYKEVRGLNDINIKIRDLFERDIKRELNGVIKVDQKSESHIYTELDEYVVTKESLKHFDLFFENFSRSYEKPTDKIGVWVSGFFGSGKSHFIKILSYLLENREIKGKRAIDFFKDKIEDPSIISNMENVINKGTKDVMLFNIDSKANTLSKDPEPVVNILMKVFNEMRGYIGEVFWLAELEEDLERKGLYDNFKKEFKAINGEEWEVKRYHYSFEQDDIVEALNKVGYSSREAITNLFESDGASYTMSVEKFIRKVKEYCDTKEEDHRLIFLVDEIGQYIGTNSDLMLGLQTVTEELGSKIGGKAWIVVTSQADIDTTTREKVKENDFSKIQGRFNTRLSLSSSNVDEVIKKRILKKKPQYNEYLGSYYSDKKIILNNLISFTQSGPEIKRYRSDDDFTETYPFVPYQLHILQKVFEEIRTSGFSGKHLAEGERSLLSAFKESGQKHCEENTGFLVPFHSFYDTIESFLDPKVVSTINSAIENEFLEEYDVDLLKILFMIRHVKVLKSNLDNLTILSVTDVDQNKKELRERIEMSLSRLEKQTMIHRTGDEYQFLTNLEQEINKQIKGIDIDEHKIIDEIFKIVFDQIAPPKFSPYKVNKWVDEKVGRSDAELNINIMTKLHRHYKWDTGQVDLSGNVLSNVDTKDTLLLVLPETNDFIDKIRKYLQIEKYLNLHMTKEDIERSRIFQQKQHEIDRLKTSYTKQLNDAISESRVYCDGQEISLSKKEPRDMIREGYEKLVSNVYNKSHYLEKPYTQEDILKALRSDDLQKYGIGESSTNNLALKEMMEHINLLFQRDPHRKILLKDMIEKFSRKPYGWDNDSISGLVGTLLVSERIKIRYQKEYLFNDPNRISRHLMRKDDYDKISIEIKEKMDQELMMSIRKKIMDLFDMGQLPEKEIELFNISRSKIVEVIGVLENIEGRYHEEPKYPGKDHIDPYKRILSQINTYDDPGTFFKEFHSMSNDVKELQENASKVISFFQGPQVGIFKKSLDKIGRYRREYQFLDEDTRKKVDLVDEIIKEERPYSRIKDLTVLQSDIDSMMNQILDEKKKEAKLLFDKHKKQIIEHMDQFKILTNTAKSEIISRIDRDRNEILNEKECTVIDSHLGRIHEIIKNYYVIIQKTIEKLTPVGEEEPEETRSIDVLSVPEQFKFDKIIKNEDDLKEYLEKVKKELKKILENSDIQVV